MENGEPVGNNRFIQGLRGGAATKEEIDIVKIERIKELVRLRSGLLRLGTQYALHLCRGKARDGSSEIVVQFLELRARVDVLVTTDKVAATGVDVAGHVGAGVDAAVSIGVWCGHGGGARVARWMHFSLG